MKSITYIIKLFTIMTKFFIYFLMSTLFPYAVISQNNICDSFVFADGVGYDNNIAKAKAKAINNAKLNALRISGIEENVNFYSELYKSEINENYQELFSTQIFLEMRGAVRSVKVLSETKEILESDIIKCEVRISCEVIKYKTMPDLLYTVEINGIKPFYYEQELLTFTIKATKQSWLYVICIPQNNENAFLVYPNAYEEQFHLEANKKYKFPYKVDLFLETSNGNQQTERLIFVLTKEKIPFVREITYQSVFDWIVSIPPNQRIVSSYSYSITPLSELRPTYTPPPSQSN